LIAVWAVLALIVLASDFRVSPLVTAGLCAIAAYILAADAMIRVTRYFIR
jgi:phosphatidylcholine synthase